MNPLELTRTTSSTLADEADGDNDAMSSTPSLKKLTTPISAAKSRPGMPGGAGGVVGTGGTAGAVAGTPTGISRIDTEPIYTALKAALGDGWGTYRDSVAAFVLGKLNQRELTDALAHLLSPAPSVSQSQSQSQSQPPPGSGSGSQQQQQQQQQQQAQSQSQTQTQGQAQGQIQTQAQSQSFQSSTHEDRSDEGNAGAVVTAAAAAAKRKRDKDGGLVSTLHLHNELMTALYANIFRDVPTDPVAPYVLASSALGGASAAATKTSQPGASDHAEEVLKRHVMALSARDRRRIKAVPSEPADEAALRGPLHRDAAYAAALTVPTSAVDPATSASATTTSSSAAAPLAKTNWDIEIRRRYAQPLASETLEFPTLTEIQSRIEPICYEEGVGISAAAPMSQATLAQCADLLETATEVFVKELVANWLTSSRVNGEGMPATARFRRALRREEDADVPRTALGVLPCEDEALRRRAPLAMDDVRLVLRLDDARLSLDPFLAQRVLGNVDLDLDVAGETYALPATDVSAATATAAANGTDGATDGTANAKKTNGIVAVAGDPMVVDSENSEWWVGAGDADRENLMGVLDAALAVGY